MKTKKSVKLPAFLRPYFWDVKFEDLEVKKTPQFILKRIIDRGNTQAWYWARDFYTLDDIKELVLSSRDLSRRTAAFWTLILGLNPKDVPCLHKPYSRIPFGPSN